MQKSLFFFLAAICFTLLCKAQSEIKNESFISSENGKGKFTISASGVSTPLLISSHEWPGVIRAFKDLQSDIGKVTSKVPELYTDAIPSAKEIIIAGTIGKSSIIDNLIKDNKIDVSGITFQWEKFLIQIVNKPLPGVRKALIIAGSDKRGTIYGIYAVSYTHLRAHETRHDLVCRLLLEKKKKKKYKS